MWPSKKATSVLLVLLSVSICLVGAFQCGQRKVKIVKTIVRGQGTSAGDWPWHVAVYHRQGNQYACGGSLISGTFVLTADHCVRSEDGFALSEQLVFVRLGLHNLEVLDGKSFQQHFVLKIHLLEDSDELRNDIALLELKTVVKFTEYVQPVCLNEVEDLTKQYGTAIGWGFTEKDEQSSVLRSARMPVISTNQCLASDRDVFGPILDDSLFCAGFQNGTTVCNGDSGGGIHFERNGIWYIGGIVSFTAIRDSGFLCSTKGYAGFTNVRHFLPWIRSVTKLEDNVLETPRLLDDLPNLPCTTPAGNPGMCVPIDRCKNIYSIISSPVPMPQYDEYIDRAECSLPGVDRSICCMMDEIELDSKTGDADDPASLPRNCGRTLVNRVKRGTDAGWLEFPWIAQLQLKPTDSGSRRITFCLGTLIHKRYVLSSAWCTRRALNITFVELGEHDRARNPDCNAHDPRDCAPPVRVYEVERILQHPDFDFTNSDSDIALLRLSEDVLFEDHVQPVCLPVDQGLRQRILQEMIVTGWDNAQNNGTKPTSDILQKGTLPVVDHQECRDKNIFKDLQVGEKVICAGRHGTPYTRRPDDGAPLGYPVQNDGIRFTQFGIQSIGGNDRGPSIFTSVPFFMDWILDNIREDNSVIFFPNEPDTTLLTFPNQEEK